MADRYYTNNKTGRWLVYDTSDTCGANHLVSADMGSEEWRAKQVVKEMNQGLPYRPDMTWREFYGK